jgi:hypothetical protein
MEYSKNVGFEFTFLKVDQDNQLTRINGNQYVDSIHKNYSSILGSNNEKTKIVFKNIPLQCQYKVTLYFKFNGKEYYLPILKENNNKLVENEKIAYNFVLDQDGINNLWVYCI